ncbi:MAG TPA: hypothetical protein VFJ93_13840 [Gaiellaceae bacterium]|nr:hypothetical protein [Gaiellaceae bacterium]
MVRRIVDLLLIAAILMAVGFGAYYLGTSVDNTSSNLAKHDSELGQTTYHRANPKGPSKHTLELVGVAIAGAAGIMIVVSFGSALLKTRRRQRWHAT